MMKISSVIVLCVVGFLPCTEAAPNCLDKFTADECVDYAIRGGGRIVYDQITDPNQLTEEQQTMFKVVVANVSDEYVIADVEPEHIIITNIDASAESDNKVTVHFFVANPTGSTFMPVALRSRELYLMLKLNQDKIDAMLEDKVTALEPDSGANLPIPTWALAILVYAGVVIVVGLIYVGTKDVRRQWSEKQEKKLRAAVLGDSDMEIGPEGGAARPEVETNDAKPVKMYRDTQVSFGIQVTNEDIATTLGITYATIEDSGEAEKTSGKHSPPPEKSHAPPEYHEVTESSKDDDSEASTSADTAPVNGEATGDKTEAEATALLEGAVNAAYEGDADDGEDETTSL